MVKIKKAFGICWHYFRLLCSEKHLSYFDASAGKNVYYYRDFLGRGRFGYSRFKDLEFLTDRYLGEKRRAALQVSLEPKE